MSNIIIKDSGETIFSSRDEDDYVFDLNEMASYDWWYECVSSIFTEFADKLDGPTVARLLYLFSKRFLDAHGEIYELTSFELKEALRG
jgi:urate oxidase